jgi:ATP-binding cassette subfamily B protein
MTLNLISSSVILISIIFAIVSIDPFVAFATLSGFGLIYVVIIFFTKDRLLKNSLIVARESTFVIKSLQEGLGGIRDVLIDGSQEEYCKIYSRADQPMRRAQGNSVFISSGPKYVLEALGMLTLAFIAFALSNQSDGFANIIPIIGAFALGAQRLLPVLQQAYGSYSSIKGGQASLQDTLKLLDQPNPIWLDQSVVIPLSFRQQIELDKVSFRYSHETPWVLKDVSLTISKGSTVGFIGTTGSGKSTLLDLVMGLLTSTKGLILIDGQPLTLANQRTWQNRIAHVPQSIFLADSSVAENIAFGVPKDQIDYAHVKHVAHLAKISKSIMTWPEQYETIVGERGVRLSGGQRQRIGIARALYKQAEVIIFDEATSALDNQTEQAVMQSIGSLGKELTIMIIAHRLTTLHNCSQIVELNGGEVIRTGSYRDFVSKLNNNNSYEIHTHK